MITVALIEFGCLLNFKDDQKFTEVIRIRISESAKE
jgi:hypothetical protein